MTLPESRKKRFTYHLVEISCWSFYLLFTCETTWESWGEGEGWRGWSDYWGYFMIFLFWESRIKSNFLILLWQLESHKYHVSCLTLVTSWTGTHQAPLSMGFSRQEYWSGLPFSSPRQRVYSYKKIYLSYLGMKISQAALHIIQDVKHSSF